MLAKVLELKIPQSEVLFNAFPIAVFSVDFSKSINVNYCMTVNVFTCNIDFV